MPDTMSVAQNLTLSVGGAANVVIDLSKVKMSDKQRAIVAKLLTSIRPTDRISVAEEDKCEEGKCVASRYLPNDEFQQIRGLKATLGSDAVTAGVICDFCLHCWKVT